jgi:dihydrofolate reductase
VRSISVTMNQSLDGVVQAPGRPDEDPRGGFAHGGWAGEYQDDVLGAEMGKGMGRSGGLLLGRRTWQDFAVSWGQRADGNPFSEHMNAATKYVVSGSLTDVDGWQHSVLLPDLAAVAALKADGDGELSVIGSAALVRSLHAAGLIDRYTIVTMPLTLGVGARMFDDTAPLTRLRLTGSVTTGTGAIIATYQRSGS